MADTPVPTYDQMMQPTLDALRSHGGQATGQQIAEFVISHLQLPSQVAKLLHKGSDRMTEVEYRLHWSRTYLKQYGLIDNPKRGTWTLTPTGQETSTVDPPKIVSAYKQNRHAGDPMASDQDQGIATADNDTSAGPSTSQGIGRVSPTPYYPTYASVRTFLRTLDGVPYADYREMASEILGQRGSPQEQVDWADPDAWIDERLDGIANELAHRIWRQSGQVLNPRYTAGSWFFVSKHRLLGRSNDETLLITERGQTFIDDPGGQLEAEIDATEGVFVILQLVAEKGPARRSDILTEYADYSRTYTTFQSDSAIKSALYARLRNLIDRTLVLGRGQRYEITEDGLAYMERHARHLLPVAAHLVPDEKQSDIRRLAKEMRDAARADLHEYLLEMDAYKFEDLVKFMLEEMGYDNVEATSPTNDKGVDVVANIELGISSVREVIQVKRHRGTISRPVLDQLRGSLHRFSAVRGTVITTGRFSKGAELAAFERGAAPITLIDGEKLLDLLLENEIGVNKKQVDYYEFAPDKLAQFEPPVRNVTDA